MDRRQRFLRHRLRFHSDPEQNYPTYPKDSDESQRDVRQANVLLLFLFLLLESWKRIAESVHLNQSVLLHKEFPEQWKSWFLKRCQRGI